MKSLKQITTLTISLAAVLICHAQEDYQTYSTPNVPGRLYAPPDAEASSTPRPLILGLHGGGGIGSNNSGFTIDFTDLLAEAKRRKAYLYLPQAKSAFWHSSTRSSSIIAQIDKAISDRNIDPNRIYITGFSMGGGGTWDLLNLYPDRFAAAIPICGIAPRSGSIYQNVSGTPIWAFHARNDPTVSVSNTRNIINGFLNAAELSLPSYPNSGDFFFESKDQSLRYSEYQNGGHAIWWQVWRTDALYDWMFAQSKGPRTVPSFQSHKLNKANDTWIYTIQTSSDKSLLFETSRDLRSWTNAQLTTVDATTYEFPVLSSTVFIRARFIENQ